MQNMTKKTQIVTKMRFFVVVNFRWMLYNALSYANNSPSGVSIYV